jgi:hypothetical protein
MGTHDNNIGVSSDIGSEVGPDGLDARIEPEVGPDVNPEIDSENGSQFSKKGPDVGPDLFGANLETISAENKIADGPNVFHCQFDTASCENDVEIWLAVNMGVTSRCTRTIIKFSSFHTGAVYRWAAQVPGSVLKK